MRNVVLPPRPSSLREERLDKGRTYGGWSNGARWAAGKGHCLTVDVPATCNHDLEPEVVGCGARATTYLQIYDYKEEKEEELTLATNLILFGEASTSKVHFISPDRSQSKMLPS